MKKLFICLLVLFSVSYAQEFYGLCVGVGEFENNAQTPTVSDYDVEILENGLL